MGGLNFNGKIIQFYYIYRTHYLFHELGIHPVVVQKAIGSQSEDKFSLTPSGYHNRHLILKWGL